MNSIDIQNMDQEEELINYQDYFNSFEIKVIAFSNLVPLLNHEHLCHHDQIFESKVLELEALWRHSIDGTQQSKGLL